MTSALGAMPPTAIGVINGLLGWKLAQPFERGWRVFYTRQHGENVTWEILPAGERRDGDDHGHW